MRWLNWGAGLAIFVAACASGSMIDPPDPTGVGGATSSSSSGGDAGGSGGGGGDLRALGSPCDDASTCDSGFCVDGVCCRTSCDGVCATCDAGGECIGQPAGTDPDEDCLGATCSDDKTCDYAAHQWSFGFGDLVEEVAADVAVGPNGETVLVGSFFGDIDFGGGPLSATVGQDIYVAKLDAMGNHVWSKSFGNVNMNPGGIFGSQFPGAVTVGPNGHIFMTGVFAQDITFGGPTLTANSLDLFVVELDANGDHVQSKAFYATTVNGTQRVGLDIALDSAGNVLLTGRFSGDVNFDDTVVDDVGVGTNRSTFVAKLNSQLLTLWAGAYGAATSTDSGRAIVGSTNNEVVVCGSMAGAMSFGATNLTTTGPEDAFLARFDSNGNVLWAKRYGGVGADRCDGLVALNGGDVAMTGAFSETASFGGVDLMSLGGEDVFVARVTGTGTEVWAQALRGPSTDVGVDIARAGQDTLIVGGSFSQTLSTGAEFLTAEGAADIFLARLLETTGAPVWARGFGGAGEETAPAGIATDMNGDVVVSGTLSSEVNLGGAPIPNAGVSDVYVGRYGP